MVSAFRVTKEDIERLDEVTFTRLMKRLLLAEISKLNLKQSGLTLSLDLKDPDGGIDCVINEDVPNVSDWLPKGKSGWQFKMVRDFTPKKTKESVLNSSKSDILPEIKKLLQQNGTYVLILGKKDYNQKEIDERKGKIDEAFRHFGFYDAKILIYSSGHLETWINNYPSLVASVKPEMEAFKNIEIWAELETIKNPIEFFPDTKREGYIKSIKEKIISNFNGDKSSVFRIVGLTGIGKTRMVYEALNTDELRDLVVYIETPEKLPPSRFNTIQNSPNIHAVFVVDECPAQVHDQLLKEALGIGGRFSLITLDYDVDSPRDGEFHIKLEKLENKALDELIKTTTNLPEDAKRKVIEFSGGYPKMAVLLAESFSKHPDLLSPETLSKIGAESLCSRMVAGRYDVEGPKVKDIKNALMAIALFKRLGWDDEKEEQGRKVCELLHVDDWMNVRQIVNEQEKRGLVIRRGRYRYISPLPLAILLAAQWWKAATEKIWIDFVSNLPDLESKQSFLERLKDLPCISQGKNAIEKLLGENGFFRNINVLNNEAGSRVFLNLAQGDRLSAIATLERLLSPLSRDVLLSFDKGRRNVVWALEKIAWWPDTFHRAARLLLKLADAENETCSNNATGVFVGLFQPYLGGTATPAIERHAILEEALDSGNISYQKLTLKAIGSSLNLTYSIRTAGPEEQGVLEVPPEWYPRDRKELEATVLSSLGLVDKALANQNPEISTEAISVFLSLVRELVYHGFFEEVMKRLKVILANYPNTRKQIIEAIEELCYYDRDELPEEMKKTLSEFKAQLIGTDFKGLLHRYVGKIFLFAEIEKERSQETKSILTRLAKECMDSPEKLEVELEWLLSADAENAYQFGMILGEIDMNLYWLYSSLEKLMTVENPSCLFLGGYLKSVKTRDVGRWEDILDFIRTDKSLQKFLLELTWRSGTSDKAIRRIFDMLKKEEIEPSQIKILVWGAWIKELSEEVFLEFVDEFYAIEEGKYSSLLLEMTEQYVDSHPEVLEKMKDILLKYLTHNSVLEEKGTMTLYSWDGLSNKYLKLFFIDSSPILDFVLKALSSREFYNESCFRNKVEYFLKNDAEKTWEKIKSALSKHDFLAFNLRSILRGSYVTFREGKNSLLHLIPEKWLMNWCDEHPKDAPYILARMIPLHESEDLHPLARTLLIKYKGKKELMGELSANWHTEGWSGSASAHLQGKLETAKRWAQDKNPFVSEWAKLEMKSLEKQIEMEKRREEERGY